MTKDQYDQAATVFSPDGRVYQVEYAREAIKRGGLAMGIVYRDGILFVIDKSIYSRLVEERHLKKFFRITPRIGAAASGLIADARVLIDILREKAQYEIRRYGELPDLRTLVMWISRIYEVYTRYEGVRPFGTAIIIGGRDEEGYHLYETDPSGVFQERRSTAIGKGSRKAIEILEERYVEGLSRDEAVGLAMSILKETLEERIQDLQAGEEIHILSDKGFDLIDLDNEGVEAKELLEKYQDAARSKSADRATASLKEEKEPEDGDNVGELLEGIPRLSDEVRERIISSYPTPEALRKATLKDLKAIKGIGPKLAERILEAVSE